jgi:hypothetical protein
VTLLHLERDHVLALGKLTSRPLPRLDKHMERAGPEASPDNQIADPVGNEKQAVDLLNLGRLLKQYRRVEPRTHTFLSPPTISRAGSKVSGKPVLSMNRRNLCGYFA